MAKGKRFVVDDDGEVVDIMNETDRVLRGKSVEYLQKFQVWNLQNFFKGNTNEMKEINKILDVTERAFLFSVMPYVCYYDCHLIDDDGEDIGTEKLVEISGLSRSVVYRTIESLISKDLIYRGKNSSKTRQYFLNPWIVYKGDKIECVLKTMFKNYHVKIKGNKRWRDLKDI